MKDDNFQTRVRSGTLRDVFIISQNPPELKKSVNALYLPDPFAPIVDSTWASDVKAVKVTRYEEGCLRSMPTEDVRFNLVATEGALHFWHVDAHGDCTGIYVQVGEKLWVLAEPLEGEDYLALVELWIALENNIRTLDYTKWRIVVLVLTPRDIL